MFDASNAVGMVLRGIESYSGLPLVMVNRLSSSLFPSGGVLALHSLLCFITEASFSRRERGSQGCPCCLHLSCTRWKWPFLMQRRSYLNALTDHTAASSLNGQLHRVCATPAPAHRLRSNYIPTTPAIHALHSYKIKTAPQHARPPSHMQARRCTTITVYLCVPNAQRQRLASARPLTI